MNEAINRQVGRAVSLLFFPALPPSLRKAHPKCPDQMPHQLSDSPYRQGIKVHLRPHSSVSGQEACLADQLGSAPGHDQLQATQDHLRSHFLDSRLISVLVRSLEAELEMGTRVPIMC